MDETLNYDSPRIAEMKQFIEKIYKISVQNDMFVSEGAIYKEISKIGLKSSDFGPDNSFLDCNYMFTNWMNRYKKLFKNLKVFEANRPFLEFQSNPKMEMDDNYIKMYIPVDREHLYEAGNIIFDYIAKLKVPHQSKIAKKLRNDNIVLYLSRQNEREAKQILEFIQNNEYIREGLNQTNPFVPTVNGIGYIFSEGESFNRNVSFAIRDYVYFMVKYNKTEVSMDEFKKYLSSYVHDKSVIKWISSGILEEDLTYDQKMDIFVTCLKNTFKKYGLEQLQYALKSIIEDDKYNYISNGNGDVDYRRLLKEKVGKEFIIQNINNVMKAYNSSFDIDNYCKFIFSNSMTEELNKAFQATLSKYGEYHLIGAIEKYFETGKTDSFARRDINEDESINYRKVINKYSPSLCFSTIQTTLKNNGISIDGLQDNQIIELYVNNLKNNVIKL